METANWLTLCSLETWWSWDIQEEKDVRDRVQLQDWMNIISTSLLGYANKTYHMKLHIVLYPMWSEGPQQDSWIVSIVFEGFRMKHGNEALRSFL